MSQIPTEKPFLLYTDSAGNVKVNVLLQDETVWMTQKAMGELFDIEANTVTYHTKEIFKSEELEEDSVTRKIRVTASDSKEYLTNFYNLDMIIAVGYRVNSKKATQFRIWATKVLKEYIIKGFALDDQRLKNGQHFGKDYFDELLEKIREIRTSERRFYQKITDIYKECSADYDPKSDLTLTFYKTVQNKFHWAITGKTAPELIHERANSQKPYMGLKTWKNAPKGKIIKSDVSVAKNYLDQNEIQSLNLTVNAYLDLAELQAKNYKLMTMKDWVEKLDAFLTMSGHEILKHAGNISTDEAQQKAETEYEKYRIKQDKEYLSDFDQEVKKIKDKK